MASQGVASSSSSTSRWRYDVFLSFRGEDTRLNFTAHLHKALDQKGIKTFIDDDELKRGEEISQALLKAIEESRISIVVFSQNYASSKWCLDELMKIVEIEGQTVLPVFYKVDPSDIRHHKNNYGEALAKHAERFNDDEKVAKWKAVLTQVANLSGWHLENYMNEAKFIEELVHQVSGIVNHTYLHVAKHPVGIKSRAQKIISLLSIHEKKDVRMVGILGAGGIGKTTIAKDIFNSISSQFEGSCFLSNVGETPLVELQNTLLLKILGPKVVVYSDGEGIIKIKERLCSKRILLILDDVGSKRAQLDKLAGEVDWFGLGSRIIITTRDSKVLASHGVVDDLIYEVKELDRKEALELFCWNAFKGDKPIDGFLKLVEDAISYVGGLPLALEVLGSYLHVFGMHNLLRDMGREVVQQESRDDPFQRSRLWFHKDVREVLEDDRGTNKIQSILVDLPEGEDMVDLSSKAFEKMRSLRLLMVTPNARFSTRPNFLPNTLTVIDWPNCPLESLPSNFRGVNLIVLRMPHSLLKELKEIKLGDSTYAAIAGLCATRPQPSPNATTRARWFHPTTASHTFCFWYERNKWIPNLEDLLLDDCTNLVEIHHSVGFLDKLVNLSLRGCYNLCRFPRSLKLRSLKYLGVINCSRLNYFPEIECQIECLECVFFTNTGIKELPSSIAYLIGLQELYLQGNKNLVHLPSSISQLQHLNKLNLCDCSKLVKFLDKMGEIRQSLPSIVFPGLGELYLRDCVLLESSFLSIFNCSSTLSILKLSGSAIVTIPACIERFDCLSSLYLINYKQLRKILGLPPNIKHVFAEGCMSLETFFEEPQTSQLMNTWWLPELELVWDETTYLARGPVGSGAPSSAYQNRLYDKHRYFQCLVSGNKIPDWFNYQKMVSNSNKCRIDIDEAADMFGEFKIIAFSALVGIDDVETDRLFSCNIIITASGSKIVDEIAGHWIPESSYVWLRFDVPQYYFKLPSVDRVRVTFRVPKPVHFKSCGFHLVHLVKRKGD
ncbi:disease resistance protein Roq1-like [Corylus avellana]|uniref:disease resistance protein Roq1-like n=1 Tax=Corylus avellana TaxID=13451 RepID=UPI00286A3FEB|nr:disease resistance protein Roq1-like [Corylus avellana]